MKIKLDWEGMLFALFICCMPHTEPLYQRFAFGFHEFAGSIAGDNTKVKGTAQLPNFCEDVDDGQYEIRDITTSGSTPVDEALKAVFQGAGRKAIRERLGEWVKLFRSK
jgi:hypothetical protein